jgi:hypothetical protein
LIFAGDEKHAAIDTPLLLPRMDGERSLGKMVRGMVDEYWWSGARVDYVLRKNFLDFSISSFVVELSSITVVKDLSQFDLL